LSDLSKCRSSFEAAAENSSRNKLVSRLNPNTRGFTLHCLSVWVPQTDKKTFACFAPLREIHGFVTAQLAKAAHAKVQSTQRKADPET
jgi:hypothetical protein